MTFNKRPRRKFKVVVKGILQTSIQYVVRQTDGDWSPSLATYEPQKWGIYDSDSCWCLSVTNSLEIQLDWLWANGYFGSEAKNFLTPYLDSNGKFSVSEMFLEILGGNYENGGTAEEAVQLMQKYGAIPRAMLVYSDAQAALCATQGAFIADYFNASKVTPQMLAMGQKFLTYVNIAYQRIGQMYTTPNIQLLQAAIKQSPLSLGVPAEAPSWNNAFVQYDGLRTMTHEVCGYKGNGYGIRDQYQPCDKTLSPDFPLYSVVQLIATAATPVIVNPIPQPPQVTLDFWSAVFQWFNGIFNSKVPVGAS